MLLLRRLGTAVLAAALLASAVSAQEAAPSLEKLLPNDTEMVFVVKVKAILESPLVKNAGLTANVRELLGSVEEVDAVLKELNFDPLKDIEQVTVAICSGSDTDKGLIIVRGNFNVERFEARADQAAKENKDILTVHKAPGGHTVYEVAPPGSNQPLFAAIANKTTIVLAPAKDYVLDALDKEAGKRTTQLKNKDVKELISRLDPKLMVAFAVPGKTIAQSPLLQAEEIKGWIDQVQDIVAGVTIDKDIKGQLAVTTYKAEDAAAVHKIIKELTNNGVALLALVVNEQPQLEPVLDLVKSIKPKLKDKTITVEASIPSELIEKLLKSVQP